MGLSLRQFDPRGCACNPYTEQSPLCLPSVQGMAGRGWQTRKWPHSTVQELLLCIRSNNLLWKHGAKSTELYEVRQDFSRGREVCVKSWQVSGRNKWTKGHLRYLPGKTKSMFFHTCFVHTCIQYLLFNLCVLDQTASILCIINPKPLSLEGKYNNPHFTGEETEIQRGEVWCPRTSSRSPSPVCRTLELVLLTLCEV